MNVLFHQVTYVEFKFHPPAQPRCPINHQPDGPIRHRSALLLSRGVSTPSRSRQKHGTLTQKLQKGNCIYRRKGQFPRSLVLVYLVSEHALFSPHFQLRLALLFLSFENKTVPKRRGGRRLIPRFSRGRSEAYALPILSLCFH